MKDKMDGFLKYVQEKGAEQTEYERVVVKPSKGKAVVGFIISLLFFIVCLMLLLGTTVGYVLLIMDFIVLVYYGTNAFTKKGLGMYQYVPVEKEEEKEKFELEYDEDLDKDFTEEENEEDRDKE